jgi:hypothetical protein
MRIQAVCAGAAIAVLACLAAGEVQAQGPGMGQKPFENTYRRPTVSAYNNIAMFSNNPMMAAGIYEQLVQPQRQQERMMVDQLGQRQQLNRMQNQVSQIQRDTRARQIDPTIRPTGHASTYMNYSHFYRQQR